MGEFEIGVFWRIGRGLTWGWEEGGPLCVLGSIGGVNLGVLQGSEQLVGCKARSLIRGEVF
jgi:hypothetical protein